MDTLTSTNLPFSRVASCSASDGGVTSVSVFSPEQAAEAEAALAEAERVQSGLPAPTPAVLETPSSSLSASSQSDRALWRRQIETFTALDVAVAAAPLAAAPAAAPVAAAAPESDALVAHDPAASEPGAATKLALDVVDAETKMRGMVSTLEGTLGHGPAQLIAEQVRASPAAFAADPRRLVKAMAAQATTLTEAKRRYAKSVLSAAPIAHRIAEAEQRSMFAEHRLAKSRAELEQAQMLLRGDIVGTNAKLQEELVELKTALRAATRQLGGASARMDRIDPLNRKVSSLEQRMSASDDALAILRRQAELAAQPAAAGSGSGGGGSSSGALVTMAPPRGGDATAGQTQLEVRDMNDAVYAVKAKMAEQVECIELLRRECAAQSTRIAELESLVHVRARDELVAQSKRIEALEARLVSGARVMR